MISNQQDMDLWMCERIKPQPHILIHRFDVK